jgi:hypothetical protein
MERNYGESVYNSVFGNEKVRPHRKQVGCTITSVDRVMAVPIALVFRRHSPPTRSRRSTGSGGESSSMLTSVNAV